MTSPRHDGLRAQCAFNVVRGSRLGSRVPASIGITQYSRSMSEGNVEIVRAAIDAFNQDDVDRWLGLATPDCEADLSRARAPGLRGVYGRDQIHEIYDEFTSNWESRWIEADEFVEAGEHVVVRWTFHAKGRSGIDVTARTAWTFTVRDRAIERMCMYQELEEALEAAGLSA